MLASDLKNTLLSELGSGGVNAVVHTAYGHPRAEQPLSARLGYNGEFVEPQTGWQLLGKGYRAYNPRLMRFHRPDSLSPFGEGGVNAYGYCGGDPINRSDPSGHAFTWGSVMRSLDMPTKSNVLAQKNAIAVTEGGKPYRGAQNIGDRRMSNISIEGGSEENKAISRRLVTEHNKNFDLDQLNRLDYQDLLNVAKGKLYAKPLQVEARVNRIAQRRMEQHDNFNSFENYQRAVLDMPLSYAEATKPPSYKEAMNQLANSMTVKVGMVRGSTSS